MELTTTVMKFYKEFSLYKTTFSTAQKKRNQSILLLHVSHWLLKICKKCWMNASSSRERLNNKTHSHVPLVEFSAWVPLWNSFDSWSDQTEETEGSRYRAWWLAGQTLWWISRHSKALGTSCLFYSFIGVILVQFPRTAPRILNFSPPSVTSNAIIESLFFLSFYNSVSSFIFQRNRTHIITIWVWCQTVLNAERRKNIV